MAFGTYVRDRRAQLLAAGEAFGLRAVAERIGVDPGYLSRVERELLPAPGETTIKALAVELREDPDLLLALAGKVGSDVTAAILARPTLMAELVRRLGRASDRVVRTVSKAVEDSQE